MRIERIQADAFGRFEGFDSGESVLGRLVVVLGPNEAGKSTLFEFLTTMLYGFQPASRDLNPLVPWGGDEARGALSIRLADGTRADLARRLRSQPSARLSVGDEVQDLRNQPVPWVEHVPRQVFRQVFAVTLGEMAVLDEETWGRIQDRVVGAMGASDLRPARAVADELESEAGESWRPNRRGKQRIREARERMRDLRARRREAADKDRQLRDRIRELESARRALAAKRERRNREEAVLERARVLLPVRAQLLRIATLREEAGPEDLFADLPAKPHERLTTLEAEAARIETAIADLDEERSAPEAAVAELTDEIRLLLRRRDEVARFLSSASGARADRERISELTGEVGSLDAELDRISRDLTGSRWSEAPRRPLLDILPSTLRDAIDRIEVARSGSASERPAPPSGDPPPGAGTWLAGALLAIAGVVLLAVGASTGAAWASALGAAGATGAAAVFWFAERARRRHRSEMETRALEADRAAGALSAASEAFRALTAPLGLIGRHVEHPGPGLVSSLERLQDLDARRVSKARALDETEMRMETLEREGRTLLERVGVLGHETDRPEDWSAVLSDRLRRAERIEQAAESGARELERLARARTTSQSRLEEIVREAETLRAAAARFCEEASMPDEVGAVHAGSPDHPEALDHRAALARAATRMEAHERADRLEEELRRGHADLDTLRASIEAAERDGAAWLMDEGDVAVRRRHIQQLNDEIEELRGRSEALESDIEHGRDAETADWVDGEIATVEQEVEALVRERDRKWVLAQLLREADHRFRDAHQPDLLRRAGRHLSHLTGGRYDRLLVEDDAARDLFRIAGPELAGPIALRHPISTGTLEQAYLGLRLAIVDHLDQGQEPLPLFIDEVFVNWDADRRARGLDVVARVAESRQVFVFTCHPSIAGELKALGAGVLQLERR